MLSLTKTQKEAYIQDRGIYCPVCLSDNVEMDGHDFDDNLVLAYVKCGSCGKRWTDTYRLVDVELDTPIEEQ